MNDKTKMLRVELEKTFDAYKDLGIDIAIDDSSGNNQDNFYDRNYVLSRGPQKLIIQVEESDQEISVYEDEEGKLKLLGVTYILAVDSDRIIGDLKTDIDKVFNLNS